MCDFSKSEVRKLDSVSNPAFVPSKKIYNLMKREEVQKSFLLTNLMSRYMLHDRYMNSTGKRE